MTRFRLLIATVPNNMEPLSYDELMATTITSANATIVLASAINYGRQTEDIAIAAINTPGCDVNATVKRQTLCTGFCVMTVLIGAITRGMCKTALMLISAGANVNAVLSSRYYPYSALILACNSTNVELVEALVNAGADIEYTLPTGDTAKHCAMEPRHNQCETELANQIVEILDRVELHPLK